MIAVQRMSTVERRAFCLAGLRLCANPSVSCFTIFCLCMQVTGESGTIDMFWMTCKLIFVDFVQAAALILQQVASLPLFRRGRHGEVVKRIALCACGLSSSPSRVSSRQGRVRGAAHRPADFGVLSRAGPASVPKLC